MLSSNSLTNAQETKQLFEEHQQFVTLTGRAGMKIFTYNWETLEKDKQENLLMKWQDLRNIGTSE